MLICFSSIWFLSEVNQCCVNFRAQTWVKIQDGGDQKATWGVRDGLAGMTIFNLSPRENTVRMLNFTSDKCHLESWRRNSSDWNGFQEEKSTPIHHSFSRLSGANKPMVQTTEALYIHKSATAPPPAHNCPDLPMKYASRMAKTRAAAMADRAAHFQLQYLEGFFSLKAFLEKVFRGSRRGGGV